MLGRRGRLPVDQAPASDQVGVRTSKGRTLLEPWVEHQGPGLLAGHGGLPKPRVPGLRGLESSAATCSSPRTRRARCTSGAGGPDDRGSPGSWAGAVVLLEAGENQAPHNRVRATRLSSDHAGWAEPLDAHGFSLHLDRPQPMRGSPAERRFRRHGPFNGSDSQTRSQEVVDRGSDEAGISAVDARDATLAGTTTKPSIGLAGDSSGFRKMLLEPSANRTALDLRWELRLIARTSESEGIFSDGPGSGGLKSFAETCSSGRADFLLNRALGSCAGSSYAPGSPEPFSQRSLVPGVA